MSLKGIVLSDRSRGLLTVRLHADGMLKKTKPWRQSRSAAARARGRGACDHREARNCLCDGSVHPDCEVAVIETYTCINMHRTEHQKRSILLSDKSFCFLMSQGRQDCSQYIKALTRPFREHTADLWTIWLQSLAFLPSLTS